MYRFPLAGAALLLALAACGQTGEKSPAEPSALNKPTLEQYVRHLFVWGPQVQVRIEDPKPSQKLPGFREVGVVASAGQASQAVKFFVSDDGRRIIQGNVFDVRENPFEADLNKIQKDTQPALGPSEAPVQVVIYSDFQCGYCREEAKVIRQQLAAGYPKDVRIYFKDFPLVQIHPWAKPAAMAGRCIYRQKPAAFWDYHDWVFEHQSEITAENLNEKVTEFAKAKGLEPVQLGACVENGTTEAEVNRSIAEAQTLGVNSTPTLFVNGRRMVGQVPWSQLKQVIDHEIEYAKARNGGEKCCELKIPSPVAQ